MRFLHVSCDRHQLGFPNDGDFWWISTFINKLPTKLNRVVSILERIAIYPDSRYKQKKYFLGVLVRWRFIFFSPLLHSLEGDKMCLGRRVYDSRYQSLSTKLNRKQHFYYLHCRLTTIFKLLFLLFRKKQTVCQIFRNTILSSFFIGKNKIVKRGFLVFCFKFVYFYFVLYIYSFIAIIALWIWKKKQNFFSQVWEQQKQLEEQIKEKERLEALRKKDKQDHSANASTEVKQRVRVRLPFFLQHNFSLHIIQFVKI